MSLILPRRFKSQPQYPAQLKNPGFWRLVDIQGLPPFGTAAASITRTLNGTAKLGTGLAGKCVDFVATGDWLNYGSNPALQLSTMTGLVVVEIPSSPAGISTIFNTNVAGVGAGGFLVRVDPDGTIVVLKQDIAGLGSSVARAKTGSVSTIAWSYNNVSGSLRIAVDGVLEPLTFASTFDHGVVGRNQYYFDNGIQAYPHKQYLFALSAECDRVSNSQLIDWSLNPWQLFKAPSRRIWATSAATNYTLTADSFVLDFAGSEASLEYSRALSADSASLSFDVADTTLKRGYALSADSASVGLTVSNAVLKYDRVLQAESVAIDVNVADASLEYSRVLQADPAAIEFDVVDATLTHTQPGNYTLTAETFEIGVAVADVLLKYDRKLTADPVELAFNGADASLRYARAVIAEAMQITFNVAAATLTRTGGPEPISSVVERAAVFRRSISHRAAFQRTKSVTVRFN